MFARIKCHFAPIDLGEWAIPLEVYKRPLGFAIRVFVFELIVSLYPPECKHQWRYYHRKVRVFIHLKEYRLEKRRVCVHCGKRETVPEGDMLELMRQNREYAERTGVDSISPYNIYATPEGVSNESGAPAKES